MRVRRGVSRAAAAASLCAALVTAGIAAPAAASGTHVAASTGKATVTIVDRYHHGRVNVFVNQIKHRLRYHHSTKSFTVKLSSHRETIEVQSVHYPHCGSLAKSHFFQSGWQYQLKVKVEPQGGNCHKGVPAPGFAVSGKPGPGTG